MAEHEVIQLPDRRPDPGASQTVLCANPSCSEQFQRPRMGRPKDFHSDACRRDAERELRTLSALAAHHEDQLDSINARIASYKKTDLGEAGTASPQERQAAREVLAEMRGVARFLENHPSEFAGDLLRLLAAAETLAH